MTISSYLKCRYSISDLWNFCCVSSHTKNIFEIVPSVLFLPELLLLIVKRARVTRAQLNCNRLILSGFSVWPTPTSKRCLLLAGTSCKFVQVCYRACLSAIDLLNDTTTHHCIVTQIFSGNSASLSCKWETISLLYLYRAKKYMYIKSPLVSPRTAIRKWP